MTDNVEDLDIVMPMHNLLEYSDNYSVTPKNFWNYYRDEADNVNENALDDKTFKYQAKITGKKEVEPVQVRNDGDASRPPRDPVPTLSLEITIPLKYFIKFWRSLNLPLIYCKVELDLP